MPAGWPVGRVKLRGFVHTVIRLATRVEDLFLELVVLFVGKMVDR